MLLRLFFAVDLPWAPPAAWDACAISKRHLRLQANARRRHLQLCQPVCVRDSACIPIYVPMPMPMPMPTLIWMYHGARACAMQLRDAKGRASASKGEIWRSRSARVGRSVRLGYPRPVRHASFRLRRQPEHAAAHARCMHAWVSNARPEAEAQRRVSPNLAHSHLHAAALPRFHAHTRTCALARAHAGTSWSRSCGSLRSL